LLWHGKAHAENAAVTNLDIDKYPNVKSYTLYTGLEPCPMCMGTIVMGHIRHVVIAAKDGYGGAVDLLNSNEYLKSKNVRVEYAAPILGYVQRCLQAIREIVFTSDEARKDKTLEHIRLIHPESVDTAEKLVSAGVISGLIDSKAPFSDVFDTIMEEIERTLGPGSPA